MRVRSLNLMTAMILSLLLVTVMLVNGCAGYRSQERQPHWQSSVQGFSLVIGNNERGGQADDRGDEEELPSGISERPVGYTIRGLPDLDYDTRTANPQVYVAVGAGDPPTDASEIVAIVVNQNHPNAIDDNPGTDDEPVATIGRAFQMVNEHAQANTFIHLKIYEGTYREQLHLNTGRSSKSRLLIEGIGDVVLSGAEAYVDWEPIGNGSYEHEWFYDWGLFTEGESWRKVSVRMKDKHQKWILDSGQLFKRQEILAIDGHIMRQVISLNELSEGSYYIDETGDRIVLDPPDDVDLERAAIEVGERWQILQLQQCPNVTLRNLTFSHAATMIEQRAVWIRGCDNVLIESCNFSDNNFRGLGLYRCNRATIRNCEASNNGAQGMDIASISNLLIENCVTDDNNWRGDWAETYSWALAGIKIVNTVNTVVRNHQAIDNITFGLWFDHDNLHVLVENSLMNRNFMDGLFLEATRGPIHIKYCEMTDNTLGGVGIENAERITLTENYIANNGLTQIYLRGYGRMVDTRVTGLEEKMEYRDLTFTGNTIVAELSHQMLFWTNLNQEQMIPFLSSAELDYNTWVHPRPDACIKISDKNEPIGFDVWQEMVEGSHSVIRAEQ